MPPITTTATALPPGPSEPASLPADPFTSLQFHFGMLLGVDDLETLAANPRGKMRLHNAWLHRAGVVWGLGVSQRTDGELQVAPGLALDGAGRELRLDVTSCVDFGRWYTQYQDQFDPPLSPDASGRVTFDVTVVARFRACLARPVPAISEPCSDTMRDVAWSRAQETLELKLVPGRAPPRDAPYPRLRLLFGLRDPDASRPDDPVVVTARDALLASPGPTLAADLLALFQDLAARDTREMSPAADAQGATTLFPFLDPADVVLAEVTSVAVVKQADGTFVYDPGLPVIVDEGVRPSHVATSTVQELLCGALARGAAASAGGPRVRPETFSVSGRTVTFETTSPLLEKSVTEDGFWASTCDSEGAWTVLGFTPSVSGTTVTLELDADPQDWLRVVARGTGPTPLLGAVGGIVAPLAGAVGGPSGTLHEGHDFTVMYPRS